MNPCAIRPSSRTASRSSPSSTAGRRAAIREATATAQQEIQRIQPARPAALGGDGPPLVHGARQVAEALVAIFPDMNLDQLTARLADGKPRTPGAAKSLRVTSRIIA